MTINEVLCYPPAWGLYWMGHGLSKLLNLLPKDQPDNKLHRCIFDIIYYPYSKCMNWSLFFNDLGGLDLWERVDLEENE